MARKRAHRRAVLPMAVDRFAVGETGCSCTCGGNPCYGCTPAVPQTTLTVTWPAGPSGATIEPAGSTNLTWFSAGNSWDSTCVLYAIVSGVDHWWITITMSCVGSVFSFGVTGYTNSGCTTQAFACTSFTVVASGNPFNAVFTTTGPCTSTIPSTFTVTGPPTWTC